MQADRCYLMLLGVVKLRGYFHPFMNTMCLNNGGLLLHRVIGSKLYGNVLSIILQRNCVAREFARHEH